jgi:hypothetical protein
VESRQSQSGNSAGRAPQTITTIQPHPGRITVASSTIEAVYPNVVPRKGIKTNVEKENWK